MLYHYLQGRLSADRRRNVDSHVALCPSCRRLIEVASDAIALGIKSHDLRERIAAAKAFVDDIETGHSPHQIHGLISASKHGADPFVAGRLLERSREEFAREPLKSMTLARAAIWVAERGKFLNLQFEGWRDCASICVRLGHLTDAWDALDRAGSIVPFISDGEHAKGQLLYARAYVGSQPDVWKIDESLSWTNEASRIFERTDSERLRSTAEMRAYIHYCRGEHAAAVEICRKLWEERPEVGLALNFASYLVEYGESSTAHELLEWTRPRIDDLNTVTVARRDFIAGRAWAAQQEWDTAVDVFTRAVAGFRRVGMEDTAIRVELGRIRAAVSARPDSAVTLELAIEDLRRLVTTSVELDRREPTRRRRFTVEALEYLRELAEAAVLTIDSLRHVEEYLDAITRGPARPFIRPVPARLM